LIYRFNAIITIKIPAAFACSYKEADSKISIERQRPRITKTILEKKNVGARCWWLAPMILATQ
jgi:hypothetical protein